MKLTHALCSNTNHKEGCGNLTEHTVNGRMIRCTECGYERPMPNDMILAAMRDSSRREEELRGRVIMEQEYQKDLAQMLVYVAPEAPKDPWKRYDDPLPCIKCGRKTRWAHNVRPMCRDGCPSVGPRPHRKDRLDVSQWVNEMFSGDDDPADAPEIVKSPIRMSEGA